MTDLQRSMHSRLHAETCLPCFDEAAMHLHAQLVVLVTYGRVSCGLRKA